MNVNLLLACWLALMVAAIAAFTFLAINGYACWGLVLLLVIAGTSFSVRTGGGDDARQ